MGLLDADVYGPSIPLMLPGPRAIPWSGPNKEIIPIEEVRLARDVDGIPARPGPGAGVVWRGPMIHGVVRQFLADVDWGELDYLIVDLPPGTGDVAISVAQLVPGRGAASWSPPRSWPSSEVAERAGALGRQTAPARSSGVIENMSCAALPALRRADRGVRHGRRPGGR